jgi:hypothetical protein
MSRGNGRVGYFRFSDTSVSFLRNARPHFLFFFLHFFAVRRSASFSLGRVHARGRGSRPVSLGPARHAGRDAVHGVQKRGRHLILSTSPRASIRLAGRGRRASTFRTKFQNSPRLFCRTSDVYVSRCSDAFFRLAPAVAAAPAPFCQRRAPTGQGGVTRFSCRGARLAGRSDVAVLQRVWARRPLGVDVFSPSPFGLQCCAPRPPPPPRSVHRSCTAP